MYLGKILCSQMIEFCFPTPPLPPCLECLCRLCYSFEKQSFVFHVTFFVSSLSISFCLSYLLQLCFSLFCLINFASALYVLLLFSKNQNFYLLLGPTVFYFKSPLLFSFYLNCFLSCAFFWLICCSFSHFLSLYNSLIFHSSLFIDVSL